MNGIKVVRRSDSDYVSFTKIAPVVYEIGKPTKRFGMNGPLAGFKRIENATAFILHQYLIYLPADFYKIKTKLEEDIAIFEIEYEPSQSQKLWFYGYDSRLNAEGIHVTDILIPTGTIFADSITLTKEISQDVINSLREV